jgi:1-aminocyclopropane-1-carboxylate deaminase
MHLIEKMVNKQLVTSETLKLATLKQNKVEVEVLRLDKIHEVISGNKWFKLKNYLGLAMLHNYRTVITFGGPYSNHIVATAWAAYRTGLHSVGVIRGERPVHLSQSLQMAAHFGMHLKFISRSSFQNRKHAGNVLALSREFKNSYLIEEGGFGLPGIQGSGEILELVEKARYSHILCAIGTGTMFLGLANGSDLKQQITGICILKGMPDLMPVYKDWLESPDKMDYCRIHYDYHFGGYAKKNQPLFNFMNRFYADTAIRTDFVYTGKLFYAAIDLVNKKHFPAGSRLLVIHSGGLQGNLSLPEGTLTF